MRKAVLHSLSAARCSLLEILNRTRDISDEVGQVDCIMHNEPLGCFVPANDSLLPNKTKYEDQNSCCGGDLAGQEDDLCSNQGQGTS